MAETPLFASDRERRLWMWTLTVVVSIYATLGLASTLAAALQPARVGALVFVLGCLLVLATIAVKGLSARPSGAQVAVATGVATAYLMVFGRMASPIERSHLIEYGIVALLVHEALVERTRHGRTVRAAGVVAVLTTSVIGAVDESLQLIVPTRVFDLYDILFNCLAATMAVMAATLLGWVKRRATRSRRARGPDPQRAGERSRA